MIYQDRQRILAGAVCLVNDDGNAFVGCEITGGDYRLRQLQGHASRIKAVQPAARFSDCIAQNSDLGAYGDGSLRWSA